MYTYIYIYVYMCVFVCVCVCVCVCVSCVCVCVCVAKVLACSGGLAHQTPSPQSCRTYDDVKTYGAHLITIVHMLWPPYMCFDQSTHVVALVLFSGVSQDHFVGGM